MNMMARMFAIIGIVVGVTATAALAQSKPATTNSPHDPAQEKSSLIVTTDYILGPEDVVEITVWRNADLSKTVTVRPDGKISLPLIGDVSAVGRSTVQLAEDISFKLKEYKENP